jgi:hypothetical protein
MTNQRQHVRYDFAQEVSLTIGESEQTATPLNLPRGGVFVATAPALPFGAKLLLHLRLPGIADACQVPCIVRWSKEGDGVGLQFEQLRPIEVWALGKLLRDLGG